MSQFGIVCIGGCHRDLVARSTARFQPATSCPGVVQDTAGGVARNVAVLLASAGLGVSLLSRIGDDATGHRMMAACAASNIDVSDVAIAGAERTGTYMAILDEVGELVAAISDLSIYDGLLPDILPVALIADAPLVFADANLPEETIAWLVEIAGDRMAVDGISRAKAGRILPAALAGALTFVNMPTACALAGIEADDSRDLARALNARGVRRAVITAGAGPVSVLEGDTITVCRVDAIAAVDVTGAGDALTATTLAGLSWGLSLPAAVEIGVRASTAAISRAGALDRLPRDVVQSLNGTA